MIDTTLTYTVRIGYKSNQPLDEGDKQALEVKLRMELDDLERHLAPDNWAMRSYVVEVHRV